MLNLTRNAQQAIRIGDDITVVALKIKGNQVILGIEAPKEVVVLRKEVSGSKRAPLIANGHLARHLYDNENKEL